MGTQEPNPRWVLLHRHGSKCKDPDPNTTAASRTSSGHPICASVRLAPPPAVSQLCLDCPDNLPRGVTIGHKVIAAHGDSTIIEVITDRDWNTRDGTTVDLLVYSAGDAAAAADPSPPPSLSLLPPYHHTDGRSHRDMDNDAVAVLRRGDGELVVAELQIKQEDDREVAKVQMGREGAPQEFELCVVRSGEWEMKRLPVLHDEGKGKEISYWKSDKVIPVGDRFLCWVDLHRGVIFYDTYKDLPELRYVSLPAKPDLRVRDFDNGTTWISRDVCVTDGGDTVKFVEIFPRCCCGDPGFAHCPRSRKAFTITTWILRMGDMAWEMDGVLDCNEFWALDGYDSLPLVRPKWSLVHMDDPNVIFFKMCEPDHVYTGPQWLVGVDMRSKILHFATCHDGVAHSSYDYFPCEISKYLGACRSERFDEENNMEGGALRVKYAKESSQISAPKVATIHEEIIAALQEIPDLARDDMLRAHCILVRDVRGFKFRSLLALPMDMRKDYCLFIENCYK